MIDAKTSVDIVGEGWPNWISAITSLLTLVAAVFAGYFAKQAAHWTRKQAEATDDQVKIARAALDVARQEATDARADAQVQREDAERAHRRLEESRVDQLAPVVFAHARRGGPDQSVPDTFQYAHDDGLGPESWKWEPVWQGFEVPDGHRFGFRFTITITFENISDRVARIDILEPGHGDIDVRQGDAIVLPPRESRDVVWVRTIRSGALATEEMIAQPENWLFNMRFWVRDLGMNVRDEYLFNGDLRHFKRDGSRLVVVPFLDFPWEQNVAGPTQPRKYERLDAAASGEAPR